MDSRPVWEIKPSEIPDRGGGGRKRGREESITDNDETRTFKGPKHQNQIYIKKMKIRDRKTFHANINKNKLIFQPSKQNFGNRISNPENRISQ